MRRGDEEDLAAPRSPQGARGLAERASRRHDVVDDDAAGGDGGACGDREGAPNVRCALLSACEGRLARRVPRPREDVRPDVVASGACRDESAREELRLVPPALPLARRGEGNGDKDNRGSRGTPLGEFLEELVVKEFPQKPGGAEVASVLESADERAHGGIGVGKESGRAKIAEAVAPPHFRPKLGERHPPQEPLRLRFGEKDIGESGDGAPEDLEGRGLRFLIRRRHGIL